MNVGSFSGISHGFMRLLRVTEMKQVGCSDVIQAAEIAIPGQRTATSMEGR